MPIELAGAHVPLMESDSAHSGQPTQSNPWPQIVSHSEFDEHCTWTSIQANPENPLKVAAATYTAIRVRLLAYLWQSMRASPVSWNSGEASCSACAMTNPCQLPPLWAPIWRHSFSSIITSGETPLHWARHRKKQPKTIFSPFQRAIVWIFLGIYPIMGRDMSNLWSTHFVDFAQVAVGGLTA